METNIIRLLCVLLASCIIQPLYAQIGYYDAPYVRYEADLGVLTNASVTSTSFNQALLQSEASQQKCVNLSNASASVSWTVTATGDGLVVRYCVPENQSAVIEVHANSVIVGTLTLNTYYSWEHLDTDPNPNNGGVINANPKMRFDEVRMKLPSKILNGGNLKLVRQSGTVYIDFAELEDVPAAVPSSGGNLVYSGNGSDLQNVINLNGGATIYLPPGTYNVNSELYFGVNNTVLKGAGMWYTQIHFTNGSANNGGLRANASGVSYSGLYLTTVRNSRSSSYKAINGVYTSTSVISNVWAEHFECGAWIGQYNVGGPGYASNFLVTNCRFRNNYADGINLCKGTQGAIVEHCSFRNNGDDDMAIWSADNMECRNNTYRYNTSENCWRASGCAIYGGYNNQAHNLLIRDNVEAGLRVGNNFGGAPFNTGGQHQFYNIRIERCGTYNDLYNTAVGAIDILCTNIAGNRVYNVKFSCIEIIDSKNDAIYLERESGDGFYNLVFENISVNGTGREFPDNGNGSNHGGVRGYGLLFWGYPSGSATYCNMSYANRGGNAGSDVNTSQIGSMGWNVAGSCPVGCSLILPVELLSFTAKRSDENVLLVWSTASELNNDYFVIERSVDSEHWEAIDTIAGAGTSATIQSYHFSYKENFNGALHYRLRQVDLDNTYAYSEVVTVSSQRAEVFIAPNPFDDYVILYNAREVRGYILYDIHGKILGQQHKDNDDEQWIIQTELPSGMYCMLIRTNTENQTIKLIRR